MKIPASLGNKSVRRIMVKDAKSNNNKKNRNKTVTTATANPTNVEEVKTKVLR